MRQQSWLLVPVILNPPPFMSEEYQPVYRHSQRATRISIQVKHTGEVVVSVPISLSFMDAEKFIADKADWIRRARAKMLAIQQRKTIFTNQQEYRTKYRTLRLIPDQRSNLRLNVTDKFIEITYPHELDIHDERLQSTIRTAMEHAWKIEAYQYLPQQVRLLAEKHNLRFNELSIKNTRSFWGQCSHDNRIVLSLHLMHLPDELIDYVILHELSHTIHKNHGQQFWSLLDRLTHGQARSLDKKMKEHSTRDY